MAEYIEAPLMTAEEAAAITVDAEQIADALPRVMAEHGVAIIANVASADDVAALDRFKRELLGEFGFAGERGARAAERAVARFLDDEEVFANAKRLFELCSGE